MGLRVRDTLSDRKYHGSYEHVAQVLKLMRLPVRDLQRFYEQLAFSVMVRNGDAHLKNFGVLYHDASSVRLAPMFDVVTTSIYRYARLQGGPDLEDHTLALKLFAGKGQTRTYPTTPELLRFGRDVCKVSAPDKVLARIADALSETLQRARPDPRMPRAVFDDMAQAWAQGMLHATTRPTP